MMPVVCPWIFRTSFPSGKDHKRITPMLSPLARILPSWENATFAQSSCPSRRCLSLPDATSHSRSVPSSLPEAKTRPSGEKVIVDTLLSCPVKRMTILPVARLHTRIAFSKSGQAKYFPFGEREMATGMSPTRLSKPSRPLTVNNSLSVARLRTRICPRLSHPGQKVVIGRNNNPLNPVIMLQGELGIYFHLKAICFCQQFRFPGNCPIPHPYSPFIAND